ncbi:hypothetical protein B0H16DRAFT_1895595 [Mycena metata]|uniref:Uncharacterized protein n=1 Tax=Mycena metata TaxID=1033252 RepID=A0AAD7HNT3_9AGAR|nr:hypothetical protein B0H16DRAFT_1895595 [Mycena metata]
MKNGRTFALHPLPSSLSPLAVPQRRMLALPLSSSRGCSAWWGVVRVCGDTVHLESRSPQLPPRPIPSPHPHPLPSFPRPFSSPFTSPTPSLVSLHWRRRSHRTCPRPISLRPHPLFRPRVHRRTTRARRVACTRHCTGCRLRALAPALGANSVCVRRPLPRVRRARRALSRKTDTPSYLCRVILFPSSSPLHRPFPHSLYPNVVCWRSRRRVYTRTRAPLSHRCGAPSGGTVAAVCFQPRTADLRLPQLRAHPIPIPSSPHPILSPLIPPPCPPHSHRTCPRRISLRRCPVSRPRSRFPLHVPPPQNAQRTRAESRALGLCAHSRPRSARTPCACGRRCRAFVVRVESPRAPHIHARARTEFARGAQTRRIDAPLLQLLSSPPFLPSLPPHPLLCIRTHTPRRLFVVHSYP